MIAAPEQLHEPRATSIQSQKQVAGRLRYLVYIVLVIALIAYIGKLSENYTAFEAIANPFRLRAVRGIDYTHGVDILRDEQAQSAVLNPTRTFVAARADWFFPRAAPVSPFSADIGNFDSSSGSSDFFFIQSQNVAEQTGSTVWSRNRQTGHLIDVVKAPSALVPANASHFVLARVRIPSETQPVTAYVLRIPRGAPQFSAGRLEAEKAAGNWTIERVGVISVANRRGFWSRLDLPTAGFAVFSGMLCAITIVAGLTLAARRPR